MVPRKKAIENFPCESLWIHVVSAPTISIGGCTISHDAQLSVGLSNGRYHDVSNLSVHEGLITSYLYPRLSQLPIYGVASQLMGMLTERMVGKSGLKLTTST